MTSDGGATTDPPSSLILTFAGANPRDLPNQTRPVTAMQPMRAVGIAAMAFAWAIATSSANAAVIPFSTFKEPIVDTFTTEASPTAPPPAIPEAHFTPTTPAPSPPTSTESFSTPTTVASGTNWVPPEAGTGVPVFGTTTQTNSTQTPSPASSGAVSTNPVATSAVSKATNGAGNGASNGAGNGASNGAGGGVVSKQEQANTVSSPVLTPAVATNQTSSSPTDQAGFPTIPTGTVPRSSSGTGPLRLQGLTSTPPSAKPTKTPKPTSTSASTPSPSDDGDDGLAGSSSADMASEMSYACVCNDVRKVSLMSAADYCLLPSAVIGDKCGNAAVGEKGECPKAGAQPCQDTGHVLTNDSVCAYDKRDETYKCVASKEDLYIQKHGKARKKSNSTTAGPSAGEVSSAAAVDSTRPATQWVLLVASLAVGLVAVA